jgi:DNA invertase Pin-like site-specific DNA recombinase
MATIGYLRVSTREQNLDMQRSALPCCSMYFEEKLSGTNMNRPELHAALDALRCGDYLVVYSLSRLARSMKDLSQIVDQIQGKGASLKSVTEAFDTASPAGRLVLNVLGAMAQFEAEIIKERTIAGLAEARKQGRVGGRPRKQTLSPVEREAS